LTASLLRFRRLQSDRRRRERPLDDRLQTSEYLSFAGLVVLAGSKNPIPSRTRPLNSPAPMVLSPKTWKSRSLPGLPRTDIPLQRCSSSSSTMFDRKHPPCSPRGAAALLLAFTPSGPAAQRSSRVRPPLRSRLFTGNESGQVGIMFRSVAIGLITPHPVFFGRISRHVRGRKGAAPLQICATSAAPPLEATRRRPGSILK
jgi:hypothetical protein